MSDLDSTSSSDDVDFKVKRPPVHTTDTVAELKQFTSQLPIARHKDQLLALIRDNLVTIVIGETGCGKSTQIPQFILDDQVLLDRFRKTDPKLKYLRICVTQPRRMAAVAMAYRIAKERNLTVGKEIGYAIRFDDTSSPTLTQIKYVTDGIALKETIETGGFSSYQVLMMDEAHERSLNTDILFALLKRVSDCVKQSSSKQLPNFRVVVTSATMDAMKVSQYFDNAPTYRVEGKAFPVEIIYAPPEAPLEEDDEAPAPARVHKDAPPTRDRLVDLAVNAAIRLHVDESYTLGLNPPTEDNPVGHVLIFLTGKAECELAAQLTLDKLNRLMEAKNIPVGDAIVIPLYGLLSAAEQTRVFQPCAKTCRKIIFATNIAETSVTVQDVEFVIDLGWAKQKDCNPKTGVESLNTVRIAKSQAIQRCGRAGRSRPGKCFRIFSKEDYENMAESPVLEIHRTNLSSVVLQLKVLGCRDFSQVHFLDAPPKSMLMNSLKELMLLDAVTKQGHITQIGRQMVSLPLHPVYAKCLLLSQKHRVADKIAAIVALLSCEDVWFRPLEPEEPSQSTQSDVGSVKRQKLTSSTRLVVSPEALKAHAQFYDSRGDHLTLYNVYKEFCLVSFSQQLEWCHTNYLHHRALAQARDIHRQLLELIQENLPLPSEPDKQEHKKSKLKDVIMKVLAEGCFLNTARLSTSMSSSDSRYYYVSLRDGLLITLDKSSSLAARTEGKAPPEYVIYHELIKTPTLSRKEGSTSSLRTMIAGQMKVVSKIEGGWVTHLLPKLNQIDSLTLFRSQRPREDEPDPFSSKDLFAEPLRIFKSQPPPAEVFKKARIDSEEKQKQRDCDIQSAKQRYLQRKAARQSNEP